MVFVVQDSEDTERYKKIIFVEREVSIFLLSRLHEENSVPACGCQSTISHLISSFVFISSANLVLIIEFNAVLCNWLFIVFPTSTGIIQFGLRRSGLRGLGTCHASCSNVGGMSLQLENYLVHD